MGMYGADVAELKNLAKTFSASAQRLDSSAAAVSSAIKISAWVGPFAVSFRMTWQNSHSKRMHAAAQMLRDSAQSLLANAHAQEEASAASGGSSTYRPFPSPKSVSVTAEKSKTDSHPTGAYGPNDVISMIAAAGEHQSSVTIRTIVHADGSKSYIVLIPGTQDWNPLSGGSNPFDIGAAGAAGLGQETDVSRAVKEAMIEAGIGPNDPVMLAGHSLGGLTAANLAADPAFAGAYTIKSVVSVGANVTNAGVSSSIPVTSIVNAADPVVGITGAAGGLFARTPQQNVVIGFVSPDIQNSRFEGDLSNAVFTDHSSFSKYSGFAATWFLEGNHKALWQSQTADFQVDADSSSSTTVYDAAKR